MPNMPMGGQMDDPNAGGPMTGQMDGPNAGDQMPDQQMDGQMPDQQIDDPNAGGENSDDTKSIIDKLSDEDKEAVRSYAKSMLRDKSQNGDEIGQGEEQPMMEQVIFTKKQLNVIKENLGGPSDELMAKDNGRKGLSKTQSSSPKSPFSSPF